jgi:hypothetical protein
MKGLTRDYGEEIAHYFRNQNRVPHELAQFSVFSVDVIRMSSVSFWNIAAFLCHLIDADCNTVLK